MRDERPPPVITIRNPGAPSETYEVIGSAPPREPRRLSRRQQGLAFLGVLALATAGVGTWSAAHLRHERDLDAASLRSLHLLTIPAAVSSFRADTDDDIALGFLNLSTGPLTVVSVRYDAPGFPELRPRKGTVPLNDPTFLSFPLAGPCPRQAPALAEEGAVVVQLRTDRGVASTVRVGDDGALGFGSDYADLVAQRCSVYRPGDSLVADEQPRVTRVGADLRLVWTVRNQSAYSRRLLGVRVTGGLTVVNAIAPFSLEQGQVHRLEVRLRVASCEDARHSWAFAPFQQGTTPTFQTVSSDGALSLTVEGDGRVDRADSFLLAGQVDDVRSWVEERCPR